MTHRKGNTLLLLVLGFALTLVFIFGFLNWHRFGKRNGSLPDSPASLRGSTSHQAPASSSPTGPAEGSLEAISLTDTPPLYPRLQWQKVTKQDPDYVAYEQVYTDENSAQKEENKSFPFADGEEWAAELTNRTVEDYVKERDSFWSYYRTAFAQMGWKLDVGLKNSADQSGIASAGLFGYLGLKDNKLRLFVHDYKISAHGARYVVFLSSIIPLGDVPSALTIPSR